MSELQTSLLDGIPALEFDGRTFIEDLDLERLSGHMKRVFTLMRDGEWRTLRGIQAVTGGSEAGCSARLRDARKARFGGHTVEKRRIGDPKAGLFQYRLLVR